MDKKHFLKNKWVIDMLLLKKILPRLIVHTPVQVMEYKSLGDWTLIYMYWKSLEIMKDHYNNEGTLQ